jgi:hypothetical protein
VQGEAADAPGRPRRKGARLPELIWLAGLVATPWQHAEVWCYSKPKTLKLTVRPCLWYGVLGAQPVQVVMCRPPHWPDGYQLAIVTTDRSATPADLIERYALRWNVEVWRKPARSVASARPATAPAAWWNAPCRLGCCATACW